LGDVSMKSQARVNIARSRRKRVLQPEHGALRICWQSRSGWCFCRLHETTRGLTSQSAHICCQQPAPQAVQKSGHINNSHVKSSAAPSNPTTTRRSTGTRKKGEDRGGRKEKRDAGEKRRAEEGGRRRKKAEMRRWWFRRLRWNN